MSSVISGAGSGITLHQQPQATVPSDGDAQAAASVITPFQTILNILDYFQRGNATELGAAVLGALSTINQGVLDLEGSQAAPADDNPAVQTLLAPTSTRKLLWKVIGSSFNVYLYSGDAGGSKGGFAVSVNCSWKTTGTHANHWVADVAVGNAKVFEVTADGAGPSYGITLYRHQSGIATPWTDSGWNEIVYFSDLGTVVTSNSTDDQATTTHSAWYGSNQTATENIGVAINWGGIQYATTPGTHAVTSVSNTNASSPASVSAPDAYGGTLLGTVTATLAGQAAWNVTVSSHA